MKFNKFFMLAMAGLAMTACSNDEEMGNNLSGNGVVEVRIVAPQTRALETPDASTDKVTVEGKIQVRLTADKGGGTKEITADGGVHTVKFYGVQGPDKIEAWINDGDTKGKGSTEISDMQIVAKSIPAYGSNYQFNLTGKTETTDGTKYEMYETRVDLKIPVARLEISGIKHVHLAEPDKGCKYSALTIDGIYLDKVSTTLGGEVVDYSWPAVEGGAPLPILRDEITEPENDFMNLDKVWPSQESGKVYAYNFYPSEGQQPLVKIYFENATASDTQNPVSEPRYAVIKSYNGNPNFKFEAGRIYRITDVQLEDKNIIGDEEGNTLYGVNVTVTEAQWSIENITGEWAEQ